MATTQEQEPYRVVEATSSEELQRKVRHEIKTHGYMPQGSVTAHYWPVSGITVYLQAVIQPSVFWGELP